MADHEIQKIVEGWAKRDRTLEQIKKGGMMARVVAYLLDRFSNGEEEIYIQDVTKKLQSSDTYARTLLMDLVGANLLMKIPMGIITVFRPRMDSNKKPMLLKYREAVLEAFKGSSI